MCTLEKNGIKSIWHKINGIKSGPLLYIIIWPSQQFCYLPGTRYVSPGIHNVSAEECSPYFPEAAPSVAYRADIPGVRYQVSGNWEGSRWLHHTRRAIIVGSLVDSVFGWCCKGRRGVYTRGHGLLLILVVAVAFLRWHNIWLKIAVLGNSRCEAGCPQRNTRFWARNIFRLARRIFLLRPFFSAETIFVLGACFF